MAYTNSYPQFPVVKVEDPRTSLWNNLVYTAPKSGKQQTYNIYPANSYSTNNITINCPPNNKNQIIGRWALLHIPLQLDFDQAPLIGVDDALRAYPFHSCVTTSQCKINGTTISVLCGELIHKLMRFQNKKECREENSTTATMNDFYQAYSDYALYGMARNPLANIGVVGQEASRGGFPFTQISPTRYRFDLYEPLYLLSPWLFDGEKEHCGYINIQSMELTFLLSDLARAWSHSSNGNPITSVTGSFFNVPELLLISITPQDITPLPSIASFPYFPINRYVSNCGSVVSGGTLTVNSQNLQLGQIPRRLYLWVQRRQADWTFNTTDTTAFVSNISVQWNNQSSLLSSARDVDLYRMSVKNGYNAEGGFPAWKSYTGSIICLDPAFDLSLSSSESVGLLEQFMVNFTVTFKNISAETINYDLTICTIDDGIMSIFASGQCTLQTGILSKSAILASEQGPQLNYQEVTQMEGGSVFSKLKSFVNTGSRYLGQAAELGAKVLPQYAAPLQAVSQISRGVQNITGGRIRRRRRVGRARRRRGYGLVGGELVSENQKENNRNEEDDASATEEISGSDQEKDDGQSEENEESSNELRKLLFKK